MRKNEVVIASAVRTAIGSFNGAHADVAAVELGALVIKEAVLRANILAEQVDEVIMGNVLQAGQGQNPARQSALQAGLPVSVPAMTINKVCGSGLKAVHLAAQSIALGEAEIVLAGGMENMSRAPFLLEGVRSGYKFGDRKLVDSMIRDGLWCAMSDVHMGITAENICDQYRLDREQLDEFAERSHRRAADAIKAGRLAEEIVPVAVPQRKGNPVPFTQDEMVKPETSQESLSALKPAFRMDGKVTAGNSSGINDGAACLVLTSRGKAEQLGIRPLAVVRSNASAGVEPKWMGLGPVPATRKALEKAGLSISDMDLVEANEAFAAQSLAVCRELGFAADRVNVNGGAVSLGHPIGASGARILVTLVHELRRRENARYGLATLCIGGGQGVATIVEKC